tara:strand:- start:3483 stop:3680 length:198 start_codon:yes stop_codon:yes gene_type:complete
MLLSLFSISIGLIKARLSTFVDETLAYGLLELRLVVSFFFSSTASRLDLNPVDIKLFWVIFDVAL